MALFLKKSGQFSLSLTTIFQKLQITIAGTCSNINVIEILINCYTHWMESRAGLYAEAKRKTSCRNPNPDRPAYSLYSLRQAAPSLWQ
jgi:hypothetical protein